MVSNPFARVTTLAFDIFGTVLDWTGSITPPTQQFLQKKGAAVSAELLGWRVNGGSPVPGEPMGDSPLTS
jgi:hypothetical protein